VKKKPCLCLLTYQRSSTEAYVNESKDVPADATLNKYLSAINKDDFSYDDEPNVFASKEYKSMHPLFSRLFSIPATSDAVERVFCKGR